MDLGRIALLGLRCPGGDGAGCADGGDGAASPLLQPQLRRRGAGLSVLLTVPFETSKIDCKAQARPPGRTCAMLMGCTAGAARSLCVLSYRIFCSGLLIKSTGFALHRQQPRRRYPPRARPSPVHLFNATAACEPCKAMGLPHSTPLYALRCNKYSISQPFCQFQGLVRRKNKRISAILPTKKQNPPQNAKTPPQRVLRRGRCRKITEVLGSALGFVLLAVTLQLLLVAIDEVSVGDLFPNGLIGGIVMDRRIVDQEFFLLFQAGAPGWAQRSAEPWCRGAAGGGTAPLPLPALRYGPC